ncbi:MAG: DUF86 domain-containing protein [Bifidobacteriaceae bacterium]|nr:DUF86 domain-containing protein [Bifidobacteriaceae bacterium]
MSTPPDISPKTKQALADLIDFCDQAARLVARGKAAWDQDEALRWAGEAVLHRVGEAVARLSQDYTAAHPEVPWRKIKATRNIIAHDYGIVDYEILWRGLAKELPRVRAAIAADAAEAGTGG